MTFDAVNFSYSIFTHVRFVDCIFKNCVLNETSFNDCAFVKNVFERNKGIFSSSFINCDFYCGLKETNEPGEGLISSVIPMACPTTGGFIGWKAAYKDDEPGRGDYCLVKLYIPDDAKRSSAGGRKCRCSKAKVLGIYDLSGEKLSDDTHVVSFYSHNFKYNVGEYVKPIGSPFCEDRFEECAPGIHFFIDKEEALHYINYCI